MGVRNSACHTDTSAFGKGDSSSRQDPRLLYFFFIKLFLIILKSTPAGTSHGGIPILEAVVAQCTESGPVRPMQKHRKGGNSSENCLSSTCSTEKGPILFTSMDTQRFNTTFDLAGDKCGQWGTTI